MKKISTAVTGLFTARSSAEGEWCHARRHLFSCCPILISADCPKLHHIWVVDRYSDRA